MWQILYKFGLFNLSLAQSSLIFKCWAQLTEELQPRILKTQFKILKNSGPQSVVPGPSLSGSLLEIQILRPYPNLPN